MGMIVNIVPYNHYIQLPSNPDESIALFVQRMALLDDNYWVLLPVSWQRGMVKLGLNTWLVSLLPTWLICTERDLTNDPTNPT